KEQSVKHQYSLDHDDETDVVVRDRWGDQIEGSIDYSLMRQERQPIRNRRTWLPKWAIRVAAARSAAYADLFPTARFIPLPRQHVVEVGHAISGQGNHDRRVLLVIWHRLV